MCSHCSHLGTGGGNRKNSFKSILFPLFPLFPPKYNTRAIYLYSGRLYLSMREVQHCHKWRSMPVCSRLPPAGDFTSGAVVSDGDFSHDSAPPPPHGQGRLNDDYPGNTVAFDRAGHSIEYCHFRRCCRQKKPAYSQLPIRTIIMPAASKIQP